MPESTVAKLLSTTAMPLHHKPVVSMGAIVRTAGRLALQGEASAALRLISNAIFHGSIAGKSVEVKRRVIRFVWKKVHQHANQSRAEILDSLGDTLFIAINRECENGDYEGHVLEMVELFQVDFELSYRAGFWLGVGSSFIEPMTEGDAPLEEDTLEFVAKKLEGYDRESDFRATI